MVAVLHELVEPCSNADDSLGDLDLGNRPSTSRISARQQIRSIVIHAEGIVAVPLVRITSPAECASHRCPRVRAGCHLRLGHEERVGAQAVDEVLEVGLHGLVVEAGHVGEGVDDAAIPDGVEVGLDAVEDDRVVVAAACLTSDVHGLRNVLREVRDELDGVGALGFGGVETSELGFLDAALECLRLVGNGRNNAAI